MGDEQVLLAMSVKDFLRRSGLTTQDRRDCVNYIKKLYPSSRISLSPSQGYCSLTFFVDDDKVVQFRPHGYRLALEVTQAAREVYGSFAPETKYIGLIKTSCLLVYTMSRIRGVSFRDFRYKTKPTSEQLLRLCRDFAAFLSRSWHQKHKTPLLLGTVGISIRVRLKTLCRKLPRRFRATAKYITDNLHRVEALPWVLTHGDIVAANVMIDPLSAHLLGFVDWAEAESLPFGICLYGLEELLGQMTPNGFRYRSDASELRERFWLDLKSQIPELRQGDISERVKLARDLGVLLWHGIAFDNGKIDRVVEEGKDIDEIRRLDAFLDVKPSHPNMKSKL